MTDISPLGFSLITLVIIAFMLWFALGTQRNIKRGNDLLQWLQTGLPLLGRRTTLRWLGSSAVELKITEPRHPFSDAEAVVVLEPRDVSWLWALGRARGRRDFLVLRARLERAPRYELEAGDVRGWTGGDRLSRLDLNAWHETTWDSETVRVAHTSTAEPEVVRDLWRELEARSGGVWRLSVRRDAPHIEVHVRLPDAARVQAEPIFETFSKLGKAVMRPA